VLLEIKKVATVLLEINKSSNRVLGNQQK